MERVVGRECEASCVHEKLAADVEEDEEEVERAETEDDIDLGYGGLLLEVLERWVLGQLPRRNQYAAPNSSCSIKLTYRGWRGDIAPCRHGQYFGMCAVCWDKAYFSCMPPPCDIFAVVRVVLGCSEAVVKVCECF